MRGWGLLNQCPLDFRSSGDFSPNRLNGSSRPTSSDQPCSNGSSASNQSPGSSPECSAASGVRRKIWFLKSLVVRQKSAIPPGAPSVRNSTPKASCIRLSPGYLVVHCFHPISVSPLYMPCLEAHPLTLRPIPVAHPLNPRRAAASSQWPAYACTTSVSLIAVLIQRNCSDGDGVRMFENYRRYRKRMMQLNASTHPPIGLTEP
jgi:hypothetical protein